MSKPKSPETDKQIKVLSHFLRFGLSYRAIDQKVYGSVAGHGARSHKILGQYGLTHLDHRGSLIAYSKTEVESVAKRIVVENAPPSQQILDEMGPPQKLKKFVDVVVIAKDPTHLLKALSGVDRNLVLTCFDAHKKIIKQQIGCQNPDCKHHVPGKSEELQGAHWKTDRPEMFKTAARAASTPAKRAGFYEYNLYETLHGFLRNHCMTTKNNFQILMRFLCGTCHNNYDKNMLPKQRAAFEKRVGGFHPDFD